MGRIFYYTFLLPLSFLPYRVLYFLSDILFFFLYSVFKYRRVVVYQNLKNSFPQKSEKELHEIEKKFYRHLSDLVAESVKCFTITQAQLAERMKPVNPEMVNDIIESGKSIIFNGGHYGNWEMFGMFVPATLKCPVYAAYAPLKSQFFDQLMIKSRGKYGLKMIPMKQVGAVIDAQKEPFIMILAGDQSPSSSRKCVWTTFLNQETAVFYGTEKFAREYDMVVVYGTIRKVKRGHYEYTYEKAIFNPREFDDEEITKLHTRLLESAIIEQPEYWLWSHKRWKRKREEAEY